ncbi:MAG TPA: VacJ family lipoprotein [Candidatus Binataceae bacterium]
MARKSIFFPFIAALCLWATPPAAHAQQAPTNPAAQQQPESDPLAWFNEPMFTFNRKLDDYVVHPLGKGWATVAPKPARQSVRRFFDNANVIPRFANNLFQLRMVEAGTEVSRFLINSTVGVAGFFDPADEWFGLKQHNNDFGLTLGRYGVGEGAYLVLPFFGPSNVRDSVGLAADGAMNPMSYLLPLYISMPSRAGAAAADAVNYRSLNLTLFEDVDRYAVDLYGAVQDGYLQRRRKFVAEGYEF